MTKKQNKRGALSDLAYIIYVVGGAALLILILGTWVNSFNDKIQAVDIIPSEGKSAVNSVNELYGGVIDNSILFLVIGMCIAALMLALMVVMHPIFFVFYFILLSIIIYVGGIASNMYQMAASTDALSTMADKLIMISYICQYLPFIIGVMGFILAIIMYRTWRNSAYG